MSCTASRPEDVATASTFEFVAAHRPSTGRATRVLEVGCGSGALARRLQDASARVLAIDSAPESVEAAVASGVPARVVDWPDFVPEPSDGAPFDAVLFSRSLHHIRPLPAALQRAWDLLVAGGRVIVEDFAFGDVDRRTAQWLFATLTRLEGEGALTRRPGTFAARLLEAGGARELWAAEDDHVTPAAELRAALRARFRVIHDSSAPYLYRYVLPLLSADDRGTTLARQLYEEERELGRQGRVQPIGRRFVGCRP